MYVAGVAVECMLRAFKLRRDPQFDERHDLLLLFKASGMLEVDPELLRGRGLSDQQIANHLRELRAAVNAVWGLWSNNYRFASEERVLAHLKRMRRGRKGRGDYLKARALELLNAAQLFVVRGVLQWPSSAK
jgi:hypothetical protein